MLNAALLVVVVLRGAIFAQSQELNTLTLGQSLLNEQTLVSAQKTFVLGFFSNGYNTYLGIWYNYMKSQSPNKTIVWVANRDKPIKGGNGNLTLTGNSLDLLDDASSKEVWSSGTLTTNSPQAFLLDTGNLVVNDTMSGLLWQSFDHPCDTLLPSLRIGYDTSNHKLLLTSWKSKSDPSPGDYNLRLDRNRLPDVLLFQGEYQLKYRMGTWNGQGFSGVPNLNANNQLAINMTVSEGSAYYSFTALDSSTLWRSVISPDGLIHRWHSNPSNEWVEFWHLPQDQCDNYGYCGQNAVCYNGDCQCLQEFVPKSPSDWSQLNFTGGCVRNVALSCSSNNGFAHMSHVKVPDTLNATMVRGKSWDDCNKLCLGNCSCSAYTVFGDDDCVIWFGDLVDIVQLTVGINDLYTRVSHSDSSSHSDKNIAVIVSVSVVGTVLVISALLWFCYRRSQQKHLPLAHEVFGTEHEHVPGSKLTAPLLDLDAIRVGTNNFSEQNIIVSSRSTTIYKGTLHNFGDLAAKRLNTGAGLEELKTEVEMLARLDHPNIIRMLGSCIGNNDNVICYEYMLGGSLDAVLFAEDEKSAVPDWPSRLGIMQGICEGLFYLHEQFRIIHRDIDPSNILLSEGLIPKISDFGRATLHDEGQSEGNDENFRGTRKYSAPELIYAKSYSVKSDVYSFGIVLLELVTGCKAASFRREDTDDLATYVRQHWTQGTADELKDPRMGDAPRGELERCIHIGLRCVQDDPTMRPTMSYIRNTLAAIRP